MSHAAETPRAALSDGSHNWAGAHGIVGVARALDFAARKHAHQRRKGINAEPYVNHLTEVALLLSEATAGADPPLVMAGLLHDTVEDTQTSPAELEAAFGMDVASLVAEVTDDPTLTREERKRRQVESAPTRTARARMIKLADKIANLRSIVESPPMGWSTRRRWEYVAWAREVVAACGPTHAGLEKLFEETARRLEQPAVPGGTQPAAAPIRTSAARSTGSSRRKT